MYNKKMRAAIVKSAEIIEIENIDIPECGPGSDSGIAAALELPKWGGKSLLVGIPKTGDVTADFQDFIRGNKNIYSVRGEGLSSCGRAVLLFKK